MANGLLDAELKVQRAKVNQVFANVIHAMYHEEQPVITLNLEAKSRNSFRTVIRLVKRKVATQKTWLWLRSRRAPLCEALKNHFTLSSISWRWKFEKTADSEELD